MAFSDINWGAVVVGAAIATAIVAFMPETIAIGAVFQTSPAAVSAGAAIIGGIAGEFFSDLTDKCGHVARVLSNSSTTTPQAGHAI